MLWLVHSLLLWIFINRVRALMQLKWCDRSMYLQCRLSGMAGGWPRSWLELWLAVAFSDDSFLIVSDKAPSSFEPFCLNVTLLLRHFFHEHSIDCLELILLRPIIFTDHMIWLQRGGRLRKYRRMIFRFLLRRIISRTIYYMPWWLLKSDVMTRRNHFLPLISFRVS